MVLSQRADVALSVTTSCVPSFSRAPARPALMSTESAARNKAIDFAYQTLAGVFDEAVEKQ